MNKDDSHLAPNQSQFVLKSNTFGERYFYNVNRGTFDKVGSTIIFEKQFKSQLFSENTLYIIIGTDSGLLPQYIQQSGIPTGTRYLFIELDEVLKNLRQANLLPDLDPAISIINEDNYAEKVIELKLNEYLFIDSVRMHSALCCQQNTIAQYAPLEWSFQEILQTQQWQHRTSIYGNQIFITRQIENVADNYLPVQILKDAFKEQTVIILAGGPSLNEILPWVVKNRQKLVVFAVARIANQLQAQKLVPDFIFAVDPHEISYNMCSDIFSFNNHPILVHSNHVVPALLNQWQGLSLYLSSRLPWDSELNIPNTGGAGPTVTNSALATADLLGFKQILLAGVDLCYTKHGITHAKGSIEEQTGPKYNTTSQQVLTYNNEYRNTGSDFYTALQTLSMQAKNIMEHHEECKIINLAKNAADAEGVIHIPPEELSLQEQDQSCRPILEKLVKEHIKAHKKTDYYTALLQELSQVKYHIEKILQLTQKGLKINRNLFNESGLIEKHKNKKNLDNIEKILNKKYKKYSKLTQLYSVGGLIKITTPYEDERELDAKKTQDLGEIYYKAYQEGAEKLLNLINAAIKRTQSRMEEESDQPDLNSLIAQWRADQSFRRGSLWKNKHSKIELSEKLENELKILAHEFEESCETAKQKNKQRIESTLAQIHSVPGKAKYLFHHQKKSDLMDLHDSLLQDKTNQDKLDYQALLKGYIAELESQPDAALANYDIILNHEHSVLIEEALNRIAVISTQQQDYNNVHLAMKCLSQLSPIYLPFFGDATRLSGDMLGAIDIYNQYINLFPEDIEAQLKLIQMYIDYNIPEAAQILLEHILKQQPDLNAALRLKKKIEIAHV